MPELTPQLTVVPALPPEVRRRILGPFRGEHLKDERLYRQAQGPNWVTFSFPIDFKCMPHSESLTCDKMNLLPPTKQNLRVRQLILAGAGRCNTLCFESE